MNKIYSTLYCTLYGQLKIYVLCFITYKIEINNTHAILKTKIKSSLLHHTIEMVY